MKLKHTNLLNSQRGSVSLLGAALTSLLSIYLLFFVAKLQIELNEAKYRKNTYLCSKYLVSQTESYIQEMTKLNWLLRTAFSAQFSGAATKEAAIIYKKLLLTRNALHVSYVKKIITNKQCSFPITKDFITNLPYKTMTVFLLDTSQDGTTKIRSHQWKNTIRLPATKIRLKKVFSIVIDFTIDGEFLPNLHYKSKETTIMGLLN